jgi:hypothetical protein
VGGFKLVIKLEKAACIENPRVYLHPQLLIYHDYPEQQAGNLKIIKKGNG